MRRATFEEREVGLLVPAQLAREEVTAELRAVIWHELATAMFGYRDSSKVIWSPWREILVDKNTYRDFRLEPLGTVLDVESNLRLEVGRVPYDRLYGLIEFILRHPKCPPGFDERITRALVAARAPYRVLDHDTLIPISNDETLAAIANAVVDAATSGLEGARQHLKNSASLLGNGSWADSVRESIHAVESAAVALAPTSTTLGPALKALAEKTGMHEGLKRGFSAIYGYTSDEGGIRHALVESGDADVDEVDAIFMLGACAAFVSYLVGKGKIAGLIS